MNAPSPYNANPELVEMKRDIADRNYSLTMKTLLIGGAVALAGAAIGGLVVPTLLGAAAIEGSALMMAFMGGVAGMMAGGAVANMVTMKDRAKLKMDEEYVAQYTAGKGNWGEGYRKEVAEYGYAGPQLPNAHGQQPPRNPGQRTP